MSRHLIDQPNRHFNAKVTTDLERARRKLRRNLAKIKVMDHPRPAGNGRLIQYLMIDRGRLV